MQVLYKKISQHDKIMLCEALYKEDDMCMPKKSCYGKSCQTIRDCCNILSYIQFNICGEKSILYFVFILDINQSIPMVAWNKNQECGLQTEHFILLLHKLGFHLATDVGKCFPRIPDHWPADHLYHLALKVILLLIYIVGSFDIFSIVHK